MDNVGRIYVADTGNNRIEVFNENGAFLAMWGSSGTGDGEFAAPTGVVVDDSGAIYVLDTDNNRVQKYGWSVGIEQSSWSRIKSLYR